MPKKILDCYRVCPEMEYMFSLALGTQPPKIHDNFSWELFYKYVHKNRLETLCAAGSAKLPDRPSELNALERHFPTLANKTIQQIQLLAFLASDFSQAGIRMLSLKGPLLAAELYGDPLLRHSNDLDILVHEDDYEAAKERLTAAGFTEHIGDLCDIKKRELSHKLGEDLHTVFVKNDLCVELHWRLSFRYPVAFDSLWENRESRPLLGNEVFCLGKTDNLIYLISHGAGHGFSRLRWLLDLYKVFTVTSINCTELYQAMAQQNMEAFLLETLLLLNLFPAFRTPVIANEIFSIRREDNFVHFSFSQAIKTAAVRACQLTDCLEPLVLSSSEFGGIAERNYMQMLPVVGKKVTVFSYLYKLMQPKRAELERFHFPDSLYFLYYIVRPFYRLWRYTPFYKGIYK